MVSPEEWECAAIIRFRLKANWISTFSQLLQQGIMVRVQAGCSIKKLLGEQLGLNPEYVDREIRTIFLDGKAVDDLEKSILSNGSILALSGAMPGLAGASLRRAGPLASFRSQITHRDHDGALLAGEGMIVLKLFNSLIEDLGPALLEKGVYMSKEKFKNFMKSLPEKFWTGVQETERNGQKVRFDQILMEKAMDPCKYVVLQIDCTA